MSGSQHHDPIQDNIDTHPVKLAIVIAIGTVALIIGIILLTHLAVGMYGGRSLEGDPSMAPEAVAKRIAPVAQLVVDPNAPATVSAPAAAATTPVASVTIPPPAAKGVGEGADGKATYAAACAACHTAGIAGAPKLGDKAAWDARAKSGKDALYTAAIKGKGAMPAKGGNASLSDAAVKAAVDYMLAASK